MSIKYTRQPDGSYVKSGDLPVGTKTVRMHIDGKPAEASAARPAKEYVRKMDGMIADGTPLKAQVYELRPVDVMSASEIARLTSQLAKAREVRKARRA